MAGTARSKSNGIAKQASALGKDLQGVGEATKQMATDSVDAVRQAAHDLVDHGRTRILDMEQSLESRVQERPMKALMIAAGIGFLIAMVFKRR